MPGWRLPSPSSTQTGSPSLKPCSIALSGSFDSSCTIPRLAGGCLLESLGQTVHPPGPRRRRAAREIELPAAGALHLLGAKGGEVLEHAELVRLVKERARKAGRP